ncbi:type II toxin-antitoxin system death-on-curing family toxin [Aerococcaceae bacterium zg-ZUI334]|uniref:type II toxin-antitoxin system death-on-curing family toxin n=1 Tax=Aerococcaceae bacterium zg-252 TaxID=2796928 RepID=UPI001B95F2E7|nr:type II toxin-antitoxin system death-on-curing family toxin [Aerococcaceae bacterium zg-ZUI334]
MNYFDLEYAEQVHDIVIEVSGGINGIKNIGQLDSVLFHIQNDLYYPTFEDKLSHLIHSLVKFHMFLDGNKRTALLLGAYFMNLNHYTYYIDTYIEDMEDIVVEIAEGSYSKEQLKEYLINLFKSN